MSCVALVCATCRPRRTPAVNPARFAFRAIACLVLLSPSARLLAASDVSRARIAAGPNAIALASNDDDDNWEIVPSEKDSAPAAAAASGAGASGSAEDSQGDPALGPDNAPVTIVEFSEFPCPFCRQAADTLKRVREKYGDRVRLVHKDFPLACMGAQRRRDGRPLCRRAGAILGVSRCAVRRSLGARPGHLKGWPSASVSTGGL